MSFTSGKSLPLRALPYLLALYGLFVLPAALECEEKRVQISPFHLLNWDGREISSESLKGTAAVVVYTYAKCLYGCPMVTYYLKDLDGILGSPEGIRYVHVSVNPSDDSAEEVRKHFQKFGIDPEEDPRWIFLNGPVEAIRSVLSDNSVTVKRTPLTDGFLIEHTLLVQVLNGDSEIVGTFDSYTWNRKRMEDALRQSLMAR